MLFARITTKQKLRSLAKQNSHLSHLIIVTIYQNMETTTSDHQEESLHKYINPLRYGM